MLCQSCEKDKDPTEFPIRKDRSDKLRPYCKVCANDINKARYSSHRKNNPFLHRCTRAKSRAASLELPFDLTPEYLESIWTGVCPVLGVELNLVTDRSDEYAAELDRFNPSLGYTKGNVHWLSRKANRIKNNTSVEILEKLLEWMKNASD
jgi:hypothetical protein